MTNYSDFIANKNQAYDFVQHKIKFWWQGRIIKYLYNVFYQSKRKLIKI